MAARIIAIAIVFAVVSPLPGAVIFDEAVDGDLPADPVAAVTVNLTSDVENKLKGNLNPPDDGDAFNFVIPEDVKVDDYKVALTPIDLPLPLPSTMDIEIYEPGNPIIIYAKWTVGIPTTPTTQTYSLKDTPPDFSLVPPEDLFPILPGLGEHTIKLKVTNDPDWEFTILTSDVPEPGTLALLAPAVFGLTRRRRSI